jgi:hypothetical protein
MNENLVILIGNARGGEETWNTMYSNLLEPLKCNLALCFGESKDKSSSLYSKAKYIWELPEYSNWSDYYQDKYHNNWKLSFLTGSDTGLAGGLDNHPGSGAIIFAFRDWLKQNVKNELKKYKKIILSRSDFYYIDTHPNIDEADLMVVEGEDWGGITDRHYVFSSNLIDQILGVVDFMDSNDGYNILRNQSPPNPERVLFSYYNHINLIKKIKRIKRVQFTVGLKTDNTRWAKASVPFSSCKNGDLFLKYVDEYKVALQNLVK